MGNLIWSMFLEFKVDANLFALFFRYVCSILKVKGVASCCCTLWERTKDASSVVLPQLLGDGGSFGCLNVTFYNRMHMHLHILGCSLGKFCTFFTERFTCFFFIVRS